MASPDTATWGGSSAPFPTSCFFLSSRSKQESGFWSWRVQAGDPGHQSHCARGSECPSESQFPVLIEGGGIPFAENHINIVISKAAFSEIKHSSPVV